MTTTTTEQITITDTELMQRVEAFDADIRSDGKVFNPTYLWRVAQELHQQDITGDAFIVALALASMTRIPGQGCRASHAQIARRASALKGLFRLADQVGWPRILTVLGITE